MRIRVVKASIEDWYCDQIDKEFDVEEKFWGYVVVDKAPLFIKKGDAEVVEDE